LLALCAAPALAQPPGPADQAALLALAAEADAAWNEKDADRMAAAYVERGSLRLAGGAAIEGREAIRAQFQRNFAARQGMMRHVTTVDRTELIEPDLALSDAAVRVEQHQPGGGWKTLRTFRNVSLVRRAGRGWRIVSVRAFPTPNPS
jgi:uncharacterized protein (TIGR02246 family)